jgi:hypothetical protein
VYLWHQAAARGRAIAMAMIIGCGAWLLLAGAVGFQAGPRALP